MRWGRSENQSLRDLSLAEFCQHYDAVELWFDTRPYAQLQLVWLLDYFRSYPETLVRLKLRLLDQDMVEFHPEGFRKWRPPLVDVTDRELTTGSAAWQAYRATTPQACFDLLSKDLSALPLLRPVVLDLLEELPSALTGLGATEMRMLELVGRGYSLTNALFYLRSLRQTRVFAQSHMTALRSVRCRQLRALMTNCARSRRTTLHSVTKHIGEASCRSPNSAGQFSPTKRISAVITRSIAGGAARGSPTIISGAGVQF